MSSYAGKIVLSTKLDTSGLKNSGKSIKSALSSTSKGVVAISAAAAAATTAIGVLVKKSVEAYADYEQLTGGVETLFKTSADKVMKYANEAYRSAGVSANAYMETVTSFSASLISSLKGDTEKAADVSNMALIDMADNANKMGTEFSSVKAAYQGFAKQNYTLLDNLKLGYGGTKTEMERLLKDAEAFSGVKYDINNLADVYEAIHQIQTKLDITGATAKEASTTIRGSANAAKAAWSNVLTAISGGGDLDVAINNFVDSLSTCFDNIEPAVERALIGVGQLIERIGPKLVASVATALIKAIPSLLAAVYQMIIGLAKGIAEGIKALFAGGPKEIMEQQAESIVQSVDNQNDLTSAVKETEEAVKRSMAGFDEINTLSSDSAKENETIDLTVPNAVETVTVPLDVQIADSATPKVEGVIENIKKRFPELVTQLQGVFDPTISSWGDSFSKLTPVVQNVGNDIGLSLIELWNNSISPFGSYITTDFIPNVVNSFSENLAPALGDAFGNISFSVSDLVQNGFVPFSSYVLTDFAPKIGNSIAELSTPVAEASGRIALSFSDLVQKDFVPLSNYILTDFAPEIGAAFTDDLLPIFEDIIPFALDSLATDFENTGLFISETCGWLQVGFDDVAMVFSDMCDSISTNWGEYGGSILQGFSDFKDGLWDTFWYIYDEIIDPVVTYISETFDELWTKHLEPLWNGIVDFVLSLVDNIMILWNKTLKPIVDWLILRFLPPITAIWHGIVDGVKIVIAYVSDLFRAILKWLGGLVDFVVGVFTLDFEKAWEGIKEMFSGAWDGMKETVTFVVNGIIWAINQLIAGTYSGIASVVNGLGSIVSGVGKLLGKENWGFSLPNEPPKIPYLARGAVLPPNKPFMAVLGDQTSGVNIEAPLETIKQALAEVMDTRGGDTVIKFTGDLAQLARILKPVIEQEDRRVGGRLVRKAGT